MYYSQRNDNSPFSFKITAKFWEAYMAYLSIMVDNDWFHEKYGDYNEQDQRRDINSFKLERQMIVDLGFGIDLNRNYSHSKNRLVTEEILDVIEFIFKQISKVNWEWDINHGEYPESFDRGRATYEYTCKINELFKRHKLAYRLEKGMIERYHSGVLDESLAPEIFSVDERLRNEATQAVKLFRSRNSADIKTALTSIANTFEQAKTLQYPEDKRESVKQIIQRISGNSEKLEDILNQHFLFLTDISNAADIRHKEEGKIIICDGDIQEYLFYSYYNAIRLITKKLEDKPPF